MVLGEIPGPASVLSTSKPHETPAPTSLENPMAVLKLTDAELHNRFIYHSPPNQQRRDAHASVSDACLNLALFLRDLCPMGRNLSLALTHLENVRMRANAALACDSTGVVELDCAAEPSDVGEPDRAGPSAGPPTKF